MPRYCAKHFTVLEIDQWMIPVLSDFLVLYVLVLFLSILRLLPKKKQRKEGENTQVRQFCYLLIGLVRKKLIMTFKSGSKSAASCCTDGQ